MKTTIKQIRVFIKNFLIEQVSKEALQDIIAYFGEDVLHSEKHHDENNEDDLQEFDLQSYL